MSTEIIDMIIKAGALFGAIGALWACVWKFFKWVSAQDRQSAQIDELKQKEAEDIREIKAELCVLSNAVFACLDGLKQLNCDGEVTQAHEKLRKHLSRQAHDVE